MAMLTLVVVMAMLTLLLAILLPTMLSPNMTLLLVLLADTSSVDTNPISFMGKDILLILRSWIFAAIHDAEN